MIEHDWKDITALDSNYLLEKCCNCKMRRNKRKMFDPITNPDGPKNFIPSWGYEGSTECKQDGSS